MSTIGGIDPRFRDGVSSGLLRLFAWLTMVFILTPLVIISVLAFNSGNFLAFPPEGFSLRWIEATATDPGWLEAIQNSFLVGIPASLIATSIGTVAAYALYRYDYQFGIVVVGLAIIPVLIPPVILAVMYLTFFAMAGSYGSIWNVIIAHAIFLTPFPFFLIAQGLKEVDRSYEEAARNLGASQLTAVRTITLPLVSANIVAGFLFAFILSLNEYIIAWLLAGFSVPTVPVQIFTSLRYNYSPTIAVVSLFFIAVTVIGLSVADYLTGGLWE